MSGASLPAEVGSMVSRVWASRRGLRYAGTVGLIVALMWATLAVPSAEDATALTVHGAVPNQAVGEIRPSLSRGAEPRTAVATAGDFAFGGGIPGASSNLTVGTPVPSPSSIDLGQTVNFTSKVTGGSGGNKYVWNGLPAGCSSVSKRIVTCTPSKTGGATISLSVTDSNGTTVTSDKLSFTTRTDPAISSFGASPSTVRIDDATTFTASVTGGVKPYTYSYSGLPSGCSSKNVTSLPCTPSASGSFSVNVSVVDANSFVVNQTTQLNVTSPSRVLGLPPDQGYAVIAGGVVLLAVLVAIAVLLAVRRRRRRRAKPRTPPPQGTAVSKAGTGAPPPQQNLPPPGAT